MNRYNILWIDDQFNEQSKFMDEADAEGFDVSPFKTSEEGMAYLEDRLQDVHGIILDAKVFKASTDERASERGLTASRQEIARICAENNMHIPHVVLTGQPDLMDNEEFEDRMDGTQVFSKNADNDMLFNRLRELIADSFGARMRNKHSEIYDACSEEGLGIDSWEKILTILSLVENEGSTTKTPYPDLRILLEKVFRQLHQHKVLHEAFVGKDVKLGQSCTFLAGRPVSAERYGPKLATSEAVFPVIIAKTVDYIITCVQPALHSEDLNQTSSSDRSIVYLEKYVPKHHLLPVLTHMLLDVITWAQSYIQENSDPKENEERWVNLSEAFTCEGVVVMEGSHRNIRATTHTKIIRTNMRPPHNVQRSIDVDDRVSVRVRFDLGNNYPTVISVSKL